MSFREALTRTLKFLFPPNDITVENYGRFAMTDNDKYFGRMNDPTSASRIQGPCGDSMEFYLVIKDDVIDDVKYYTEGCENTKACGYAVARRIRGKTIVNALSTSPGEIIMSGECQPEEGRHCAILAVSTMYRAVADYLLMP